MRQAGQASGECPSGQRLRKTLAKQCRKHGKRIKTGGMPPGLPATCGTVPRWPMHGLHRLSGPREFKMV